MHETVDTAFPKLSCDQIHSLERFGACLKKSQGESVWQAGQANMCMFVVIEGEMRVFDPRTGSTIAVHEEGSFSGDVDVINGRPALMSAEAASDLRLIEIPGERVRDIVGEMPDLGETILRAFLRRRALLQASNAVGVLVVGSRYCPDSLRLREFLVRSRIPMHWEDVEGNPDAQRMLDEFGVCVPDTPLVVTPKGDVLRSPSNAEVASILGIRGTVDGEVVDVVIIGAGPAGLAAAVYGASEGLKTLVVDGEAPGGQAGTSSRIENYMGFPFGISGQQLADGAITQAERFGARLMAPASTISLTCGEAGLHDLEIAGMGKIATRCVVLATGARYREMGVDRQDEFEGRGVYYAATNVERLQCGKAPVAVVGAGNSAGQAAVFMAEHAGHVYMVVRGDDLRKSMSSYLANRIEVLAREGKLSLMLDSEICELKGDRSLSGAVVRNGRTGEAKEVAIEGVFVMIGAVPRTEWLRTASKVALDEKGFVLTGADVVARGLWASGRSPYFLETSCPGVFAVGDTRAGSVKRVASAVGEGSMAIALVHQYLANS